MTRSQAIKIYLETHPTAEEMVRRLTRWNPKLSIPENGRLMGVTGDHVRKLALNCNLKYKKVGSGKNYGKVKCLTHQS